MSAEPWVIDDNLESAYLAREGLRPAGTLANSRAWILLQGAGYDIRWKCPSVEVFNTYSLQPSVEVRYSGDL